LNALETLLGEVQASPTSNTVLGRLKDIKDALALSTEASVDAGIATGGSNTTVTDTAKSWEADCWKNALVEVVVAGVHYLRFASGNTADTITIAALPGGVTVALGDTYQCKIPVHVTDIERVGGTTQTGRDWSLDFKALTDDSIKGLLKSIGDIAAAENLVSRIGLTTDTIADVGGDGSLNAKLRRATQGLEDLKTLIVLAAGSAIIGKVGIDQTTPGTTDRTTANVDKIGGTAQTGRDITQDLRALTDVAITGVMKTLGDIGAGTSIQVKLAAIQTAVELIDNAVSGTKLLVTEDNSASLLSAIQALRTASTLDTLETAIDAVTSAIGALSDGANVVTAIQALQAASETLQSVIDGIAGTSPNTKTLYDLSSLIGEVQASPTANTLLARLKDILSLVVLAAGTNIIGKVGIDQTTPGTTNAVEDVGYGSSYRNTATMTDDNPTRFETSVTKLRYAKIKVTTNAMVFGDISTQDWNVAADETIELAKFDLSTLYFKNAGAGSNGTVNIIGVTE
jgi:hypothetical protein